MNNGTNCTALGGSSVETSACNIYPCTEGKVTLKQSKAQIEKSLSN